MALFPGGHEEFKNHVGSGLAMINHNHDHLGSTAHAADATVADWKATTRAGFAALHETDKAGAEPQCRHIQTLADMGIYGNTEVAASNTQALAEAQFTAQDPSFPASHRSARAR
jgi:hypothetical protein